MAIRPKARTPEERRPAMVQGRLLLLRRVRPPRERWDRHRRPLR